MLADPFVALTVYTPVFEISGIFLTESPAYQPSAFFFTLSFTMKLLPPPLGNVHLTFRASALVGNGDLF